MNVKLNKLIFYPFLLFCNYSYNAHENNEINVIDSKKSENTFVNFFKKHKKHSLLYKGLKGETFGFIQCYLSPNSDCLKFISDIILSLIGLRYECKYIIKKYCGLSFSFSLLDGVSCYNILTRQRCLHFFDFTFGFSYIVLRKKFFYWNMYAGIGFMWGIRLTHSLYGYLDEKKVENLTEEKNKTNLINTKEDFANKKFCELLKIYFSRERLLQNIKNFDIILDLSVFDFTIKDHFRINLAWKCDFYNFFTVIKGYNSLSEAINLSGSLSIGIGYTF